MPSLDQNNFEFGTGRKTQSLLDSVNRNPDPVTKKVHVALGIALEGKKLTVSEFADIFNDVVTQHVPKEDWDKLGISMLAYARMLTENDNAYWYHNLDRYVLGMDQYQPFIPAYNAGNEAPVDASDLSGKTVEELRTLAAQRNVDISGLRLKKDMIKELTKPNVEVVS